MAAANFQTLLSKPTDEIHRPKPLPAGTYYGSIASREYGESKEKKTPYVRLVVKLQAAGADVTDLVTGEEVSKKTLRKDYYLTEDSQYRVLEFAKSCSIPTDGRSLGEVIEDTINQQVMVEVTTRIVEEDVYNDINKMSGVQ